MQPVLTVTLNPAVDQTVHLPGFRTGQDHRYEHAHRSAGGKGINVARTLQGLGVGCRATGFLGGPGGAYIRQRLHEEKIPAQFIPIRGETRISWTIIDDKSRRTTRLLEKGPLVSPRERAAFKRTFRQLLIKSEIVVLSGRNVPGVGDDFYAQLVRLCHRAGKRVVLDTSGEPLVKGVAEQPFMIKPNRQEAELLLQQPLRSRGAIRRAMRAVVAAGVEVMILSLGARGAVAVDARHCLWARPPRIHPVSHVGCGDALIGGFLAAQHRSKSFSHSVQWAVAAGTVNALHLQPGRVTRREVREMFGQVQVEQF